MNLSTTSELVKIISTIKPVPSFARSVFFPEVRMSTSEQIVIDEETDKARVTPFVHPIRSGIVERIGYASKHLQPAYIKDERRFNPNAVISRAFGEPIGGSMTPAERMTMIIRQNFNDQVRMKDRRIEVMCMEALVNGTQTIKGTGFDCVINYGRAAGNAYSVGTAWNTVTSNEYVADVQGDLEDACAIVRNAGGGRPVVIMDYKAYKLFSKNKYVIASDSKWVSSGLLTSSIIDPKILSDGEARFAGMYGDIEVWIYGFEYLDPYDNTLKNVMPDNTVLVAGTGIGGAQYFGMVQNMKALEAMESFPSMWDLPDGSARMIKFESAPLMYPGRVNGTVKLTVAS